MKINIAGKGMIPGMGVLPPVYNVEKSESDIRRLLNFRNIRVYNSDNGLLINKKNVDSFFKVSEDKTETVVTTEENVIVETPEIVTQPIENVIETIEEPEAINDDINTITDVQTIKTITSIENTSNDDDDITTVDESDNKIDDIIVSNDEEHSVESDDNNRDRNYGNNNTYRNKKNRNRK